ncbi:MAG: hypothetical protein PHW64_05130 [Sulfuricurvum sp.]|nr:hypothetical protein [Sulfuricurvum sp.]
MKTIFIKSVSLSIIFFTQGCSTPEATVYTILHATARQECNHITNPDERQQCLQEHSQSYHPNPYRKTNQ